MEQAHVVGIGQAAVGRSVVQRVPRQAASSRVASVRPQYYLGSALLILIVGFALRMWNLGTASLWTDEGLSALRAQSNLFRSLDSIMTSGNQTPLYFMLLRLMPNTSEMLLRLPSALMGLVGVALVMIVGVRLYHDYDLALWAGALLAVNPYHVWLSRTARPYALIFVLSLAIGYLFLQLVRGKRTLPIWLALTGASMVAYLTHYTTLALPAAQFLVFVFVLRHERRLFVQWVAMQVIACLPMLIWVLVLTQHTVAVGPAWVPTPDLGDIPLTLWSMTVGYDGHLEWYVFPALMIVSLSLSLGMYGAVRDRYTDKADFFWFWLIAATLIVVFSVSTLIVSFYVDRYFMMFLPAVIFILPLGWRRGSRTLWHLGLAVVALTGAHNVLFNFHNGSYQRADWRGAAQFVADEIEPDDALIIERSNVEDVFMRYFDQSAQTQVSAQSGPEIVLLSDTGDTAPYETAGRHIWVVYRNPNEDIHRQGVMPDFDPFQKGLAPMGDWLNPRRDMVVQQRRFNGVTVLELRMGERIVAGSAPGVPAGQ